MHLQCVAILLLLVLVRAGREAFDHDSRGALELKDDISHLSTPAEDKGKAAFAKQYPKGIDTTAVGADGNAVDDKGKPIAGQQELKFVQDQTDSNLQAGMAMRLAEAYKEAEMEDQLDDALSNNPDPDVRRGLAEVKATLRLKDGMIPDSLIRNKDVAISEGAAKGLAKWYMENAGEAAGADPGEALKLLRDSLASIQKGAARGLVDYYMEHKQENEAKGLLKQVEKDSEAEAGLRIAYADWSVQLDSADEVPDQDEGESEPAHPPDQSEVPKA